MWMMSLDVIYVMNVRGDITSFIFILFFKI